MKVNMYAIYVGVTPEKLALEFLTDLSNGLEIISAVSTGDGGVQYIVKEKSKNE